jgi:type VI secretion system protein ImpG
VGTPTPPRPSWAEGETAWRLVSHLALNYVSLVDADEKRGATALRELLSLYAGPADQHLRGQIEGVKSVVAHPVIERVATEGAVSYGRGLELTLTLDDSAFRGTGAFMLGAVLEQFFARYVAINAFTQTVVRTVDRGEIVRWPARSGRRPVL